METFAKILVVVTAVLIDWTLSAARYVSIGACLYLGYRLVVG